MHLKRYYPTIAGVTLVVSLAGCQPVSFTDQISLDSPGRQFQERGAFCTECSISSQVESGRLGSGSTSSSGGC